MRRQLRPGHKGAYSWLNPRRGYGQVTDRHGPFRDDFRAWHRIRQPSTGKQHCALTSALLRAGIHRHAGCKAQDWHTGGGAAIGGRRALTATAAGLHYEAFWNYTYGSGSQPTPIPASLQPAVTGTAPNINYASVPSGGLMSLAQTELHFAIRFTGERVCDPAWHPGHEP